MRVAAGFAVLMVTGCGLLPSAPPDWVVNRQPLPSCGEEVLAQGEAGNREMRTCLLEAFQAGEAAELITTQPSIEGDPITRYIRVHDNGVVEIFHDATRDRFGSGEWERLTCARLVAVEEMDDQPGEAWPADMVFIEEDCEFLPVP